MQKMKTEYYPADHEIFLIGGKSNCIRLWIIRYFVIRYEKMFMVS